MSKFNAQEPDLRDDEYADDCDYGYWLHCEEQAELELDGVGGPEDECWLPTAADRDEYERWCREEGRLAAA